MKVILCDFPTYDAAVAANQSDDMHVFVKLDDRNALCGVRQGDDVLVTIEGVERWLTLKMIQSSPPRLELVQ